MINNMLNPCCEDCRFLKIETEQIMKDWSGTDGIYRSDFVTTIWCDHMYVCKRYMEHKDNTED